MSNLTPALAQFFAAAGISDPADQAYILRNPDVAAQVPTFGKNTAALHYQNFGQKEGRPWGATPPAPAAPVDAAAQAAKAAPPALPSSYGTDAASWDNFMAQGRMATEGINRMPGVFSAYGAIPSDQAMAHDVFYPKGGQASSATNALLASPATAAPGMSPMSNALLTGGMMAPASVNGAPATVTLADGTPMYAAPYPQPAPYSPQWAQGGQTADEWAKRQALLTSMGITPYDE